jgi:hypothetical protein
MKLSCLRYGLDLKRGQMKNFVKLGSTLFAVVLFSMPVSSWAQAKASQVMGQGLYEQKGSNSCLFCHGIDGKGGNVKAAAKLSEPKTWKSFAALGGEAAWKKDPTKFEAALHDSMVHLILKGAIRHNATYKPAGFDWKAIKPFDAQMMGLGGAASVAWLKKYKDRGVTPEMAAEAAYLHVKTLDSQGIFKK